MENLKNEGNVLQKTVDKPVHRAWKKAVFIHAVQIITNIHILSTVVVYKLCGYWKCYIV